jgi:hypothetical protein
MRPRAPCCYLNPPSPSFTLLCHFTTLRRSSCARSKSKPSGLLPSSSQAVCSRAPDLPIATFHLLGDFTTLKLTRCALSSSMLLPSPSRHPHRRFDHPQALKLCALEIQAIRTATLKLSSCVLSSFRPSHCYLRSPRQFYHSQAFKLCALEPHALRIATLKLLIPSHFYPRTSSTLHRHP